VITGSEPASERGMPVTPSQPGANMRIRSARVEGQVPSFLIGKNVREPG
jgi:hypothetical protein